MTALAAAHPAFGQFVHRLASAIRFARPAAARTAALEPVALPRGGTHWLAPAAGIEIRCVRGALWLTYDGQQRDIVLEAGDTHVCDCGAPLSIHALTPSRFVVQG